MANRGGELVPDMDIRPPIFYMSFSELDVNLNRPTLQKTKKRKPAETSRHQRKKNQDLADPINYKGNATVKRDESNDKESPEKGRHKKASGKRALSDERESASKEAKKPAKLLSSRKDHRS